MNKEDIQKYIDKRIRETGIGFPSLEELNAFVAEWMQIVNNQQLADFEGYSPAQIQLILYNLFGENCPIQFGDFTDKDAESVPLFRQIKILMEFIEKEENLKLTKIGNLPTSIVKEIYAAGASEEHIQSGIVKLRIEKDSKSVQMARIAIELMGAIKKRNNSLSLTKSGKELMKDNRKLLMSLMTVMFTKFNLAYFDRYPSENIGLVGVGFTLALLKRYGKEAQSDTFYSDKYFKAFPDLIGNPPEGYRRQDIQSSNCYSHRIFDILLYHFGVITIEETDKYRMSHKKTIHRNPLFDRLFNIRLAN